MTPEQLDELTRRYLAATFAEIEEHMALDWQPAGLDALSFDLNDEAHRLSGLLSLNEWGEFLDTARAMVPRAEDSTHRKLARRLIEAKLEAIKAELGALSGRPLRPLSLGGPPQAQVKKTPRVSEVGRLYGDERVSLRQWSAKTELQNRTILAVLADLLGDPPIGDVSKDDIRRLGLAIVSLPSNMTKRYRGMTAREVIAATAGDSNVTRLEPRSVNKYQQMARSLFAWATEHDYIAQSPAAILRDVKEGRARDDRHPFSDDDLRAYFAKLDEEPERPELYWIPRIMAYSGMRLGEAAQLTVADLRMERGIWVWDVNEEMDSKKLKTEASRRLVPVHSRLMDIGVRDFVGRCSGHLLAAEWRTTNNPTRGAVDKLSKLLNRRLRDAGIGDPKKTGAHSFRHTVSARLRDASVPVYQIADILGHEVESITTGRYGRVTDVAQLAKVIQLLVLPV
ncbi:tyrosine-type recombinase/integrase [Cognatiluteimonas profundi]|uniref:tyrosine-type recombinase/integrase n=1 Tax=Cognatiluteimonas profundi TaxID=2594501 RepID=UPI00131E3E0A|nr:tyrosine-type recombinase/integrase [Lysobacter profundi]